MRDGVERYLENVLCYADLAAGDERKVGAELAEHLHSLVETSGATDAKEIYTMLSEQFGQPKRVGRGIAAAKGRVRTYLKKQARKLPLRVGICVLLGLGVRYAVAQPFYVSGYGEAPMIPRGSHVLVYKLARNFQAGDIVVYRNSVGEFLLGTIKEPSASGWMISKYSGKVCEVHDVAAERIVGRVVLNTR
jgi:hypothetical protein